jgi:hypothetical protein
MLFFALMGGFMNEGEERLYLDERGERFYKLDERGEKLFLNELHFSDLRLIDADIQDKSKGGFLSKGFAVVQTSWFVLQCVARGVERLPVTELEVTTFAFAALNIAIYILWWNKPLAVERPIYVCKRRLSNDTATNQSITATSPSITARLWAKIVEFLYPRWVMQIIERVGQAQHKVVTDQIDFLDGWLLQREWVRPIAGRVFEMIGLRLPPLQEKDNMPLVRYNFYAGEVSDNEMILALPYIGPAAGLVAVVFGAIHCIAWWFQFPSHIEQTLWRVCAAVIACTPIFYVVLGFMVLVIRFLPFVSFFDRPGQLHNLLMTAFIFMIALPGVLYFFARIILVALALTSLRSLPPGAFQTVSWANYIPHI